MYPYWDKTNLSPWAHQRDELDDYWDAPARAMLWQQRTGKTKGAIDCICAWAVAKNLRSVVIVAPLGVHTNWIRAEFAKHAWIEYNGVVLNAQQISTKKFEGAFNSALSSDRFLAVSVGKESIITDKVKKALKRILRRGACALIVDESHHFRSPSAKRTKAAIGFAKQCVMRRILSGTPTGNSPLGLWSQFQILEPGALGHAKYADFERRYAILGQRRNGATGRMYKTIDGYQNQEELRDRAAKWASVVLREDCEDLPELLISDQAYEPSPAQRAAYNSLRDEYRAELETGGVVEVADAAPRLMRLQQILSNYTVTEDGDLTAVDLKNNPRLDALVESIDGPTIVWCRFTRDIETIAQRLAADGVKVVCYYGAIKQDDRARALEDFQAGRAQVFIGQPSCAGEGIDLSAASTIIWYSHTFDVVVRDQANERATKMGGKRIAVVNIAAPGSIDEYILKNLLQKGENACKVTGKELKSILEQCKI